MLLEDCLRQPIELPRSPFWDVFKRFGRDEMIALFVNVAATAGADHLTHGMAARDTILSFSGPVIEKIGFFPAHFKKAYDLYRETPPEKREHYSVYAKTALKNGSKSLLEDVLVHDPFYVACMYSGLHLWPGAPAWMVATTSFVAAVFAVAGLEVSVNEGRYALYKRKLRKQGYDHDDYFESRFFIRRDQDPRVALDALAREFSLPKRMNARYHDQYYRNTLPDFGRKSLLRYRERTMEDGTQVKSSQVIFTRTSELASQEQFRYFPQKKEKFYRFGDVGFADKVADVSFDRSLAYDPEELLVTADDVAAKEPFFVIEVKTRKNTAMLKEAMRFVMREFPVVQTTYNKLDLLDAD